MPRACCRGHGPGRPCTCGLGNLYRFVEPVILYLLKAKGSAHGYELLNAAPGVTLTGSEIDSAALYRTLRQLEAADMVCSEWDTTEPGPARRRYRLTEAGEQRLQAWAEVLDGLAGAMNRFTAAVRRLE